jgi:extracellular factor (EF) 3-hydroxypalmitic acid methyl ester biosynthesis protein
MPECDFTTERVRRIAQSLEAQLSTVEASPGHSSGRDQFLTVAEAMDGAVAQLNELNLWGAENRLASSELWNITGHLLARGWLQHRARTKPRGYAGDYEMLARIYEGSLCDDPLGRLFDRYFQAQAAPQAVRNRMKLMTDWIVEAARAPVGSGRRPRIAIVGCAFGLEVRDALLQLTPVQRQNLQFTLIDFDPAAIEYARNVLAPFRLQDLHCAASNLFRLAQRPALAAPLADSDLILCPGLFDYLGDAIAAATLAVLYQKLAMGGRLIVFQFTGPNPTRAYMEWFANWYLLYRNQTALRALVEQAKIPLTAAQYAAEPLNVDLYVALQR